MRRSHSQWGGRLLNFAIHYVDGGWSVEETCQAYQILIHFFGSNETKTLKC